MILLHPDRRQFIDVHALSRKRLILDTPCHHAKRKSIAGPTEDESVAIPVLTSTPKRTSDSTSAISLIVTVRLWYKLYLYLFISFNFCSGCSVVSESVLHPSLLSSCCYMVVQF